MSDRLKCLSINCRRTAPADKFAAGDTEIVCSKCWKLVPKHMKDRYRLLHSRERKIARAFEKRESRGAVDTARALKTSTILCRQINANWRDIRTYILNPPSLVGMEEFFKEVGLS